MSKELYDSMQPIVNKKVSKNGSVTTLNGSSIPKSGNDPLFESMMPIANKMVNADGSITPIDFGGGSGGGSGGTTPAEKAKLAMIAGNTPINFDEVLLDGDMATPSDIDDPNAAAATLQRLINISGLRHALIKFGDAEREIYTLKGNNPTMKMEIKDAGSVAQMQVIDLKTGHNVAQMEYVKATKSFSFTLNDPDTGVVKSTFEIKQDGKVYINNKEMATIETIREFATIVDAPIANKAKPTIAEVKAAFKMLPHYDWTKNDHFEIKDTSGGKIVKITYRGKPGATEANPGDFGFKILTKVV